MSKVIEGNLLNIEEGIIVQQVNCQGVMGAGLAKQIRDKWPFTYTWYKHLCKHITPTKLLGQAHMVETAPAKQGFCGAGLHIIHIFGQLNYGRKDKCYTDYKAHEKAWKAINNKYGLTIKAYKHKIYAPFYLGAGLAGGDWKKIHEIAERHVPDIIWVKYKEK